MFAQIDAPIREKALAIYAILVETYGERQLKPPRRDAMTELIMTILSGRTTNASEKLAFDRMWEHYGSWQAVRDADTAELTELIAPSNYAEAKAPRIQETIDRIIRERGEANIDFLDALPVDEALNWLLALPGVGIKTASLVLLFNFSKVIMPVDTHVHRVSLRTGILPAKTSVDKAHELLLEILPHEPHILFNYHKACLRHGQQLCTWNAPKCPRCPLKQLCNYYQEQHAS